MDEHRDLASFRLVVPAVLLFAGWGLLFALPMPGHFGNSHLELLFVAYFNGTMLSHATLCCVWTTCGPLHLRVRLPLSAIWLASFTLVWFRWLGSDGSLLTAFVVTSMFLIAPWLLLQMLLGTVVYLYGLRLQLPAAESTSKSNAPAQFGLRQLMIITACLAIGLAGGRVLLPWLMSVLDFGIHVEWTQIAFVYLTSMTIALLSLFAMLLRRYALRCVAGALLMVGLFTLVEPFALAQVQGSIDPDMTLSLFAMLNGILVSWMLLIGGLLRWAGYRWGTRRSVYEHAARASASA